MINFQLNMSIIEFSDLQAAVKKHYKEEKFTTRQRANMDEFVDGYIEQFATAKPDGITRIFTGEGEEFNHPEVIEALQRESRPLEMLLHHYNRGATRLMEGRSRDAIYDFLLCAIILKKHDEYTPNFVIKSFPEKSRKEAKNFFADVFYRSGWSLMAVSEFERAIPYLEGSLMFNPKRAFAHGNLGDCYKELGTADLSRRHYFFELARKHYISELEINPKHPTAQKNYDSLKSK